MRSVAAEIPKNSPKNRRPVADPKFIVYADPEDPAALHALGLVAIRHGHLHHELRLALKTSLRQKPFDATVRETSSSLRERIGKLAKQRLREGPALVKLQALLGRPKRITDRRNEVMHSVCGRNRGDSDAQLRADDHTWKPFPTVDELNAWAAEFTAIALRN